MACGHLGLLKFGFSKKATKIWQNLPLHLKVSKVKSSIEEFIQIFVVLLEKPERYKPSQFMMKKLDAKETLKPAMPWVNLEPVCR